MTAKDGEISARKAGFAQFVAMVQGLQSTNKTDGKVGVLAEYFRRADPQDGAWALWFLVGNRFPRPVNSPELRRLVGECTGLPAFLVEECYQSVGDLSETLALLAECMARRPGVGADLRELSLTGLVHEVIVPMQTASPARRGEMIVEAWAGLDSLERLVFNKLVQGRFRVGMARTLVVRALSEALGQPAALLTQRLMGQWEPRPDLFETLSAPTCGLSVGGISANGALTPYPFYLAHPWDGDPSALGAPADWMAEWKWDGIRAQVVRRHGETAIWTRGEELATERFPEIVESAKGLPDGLVLDGEIVAWDCGRKWPGQFQTLQTRINRERLSPALIRQNPVCFLPYDLLEWEGEDWRTRPMLERRSRLESLFADRSELAAMQLFAPVAFETWEEAATVRERARALGTEGLMLKRRNSAYGHGRVKGDWWKWKVAPQTIDAVLVHAMGGHGKRASLFTDYTFALWKNGELLPVAKAYSGLTDAEIREVDRFVRSHTIEKRGAFRTVEPLLVMELGFDSAHASPRHKSRVAVRFPRILRWRKDKPAAEADQLDTLLALVRPAPERLGQGGADQAAAPKSKTNDRRKTEAVAPGSPTVAMLRPQQEDLFGPDI